MEENDYLKGRIKELEDFTEKVQNKIIGLETELHNLKTNNKSLQFNLEYYANALPYSILEITEDYRILFLNLQAKKILNLESENYVGKSIYDYTTIQVANDIKHNVDIAFAEGKLISSVFKLNKHFFKVFSVPKIDFYLNKRSVIIYSQDITEQINSQSELSTKSSLLSKVYEEAPDGFLIYNKAKQELISYNSKAKEMFGFPDSVNMEEINDFFKQARVNQLSDLDKQIIGDHVKKFNFYDDEIEFKKYHEGSFWVNSSLKTMFLEGEEYYIIRISDISEIKKINNELFLEKQKWNLQLQQSPLGYVEWNENFEVVEWNPSAQRIFGYSRDEALGKSAHFLVAKEVEPVLDEYWQNIRLESGKGFKNTRRNINKAGQELELEWYSTTLFEPTGKFIGVSCLVEDISERLKHEEEINKQLREKEILLSEVHHRVKNNLAIISGLLFVQSETSDDQKIKDILLVSQSRIKSMAIIHEQLYKSENFSNINIYEYIKELAKRIGQSFERPGKEIDIDVDVNDFSLPISTSLTIGLIINELLINSFKYAFSKIIKGKIKIRFYKTTTYNLIVSDNGTGYPNLEQLNTKNSLGISLINLLTQQLKGKVEYKNGPGAVCKISF